MGEFRLTVQLIDVLVYFSCTDTSKMIKDSTNKLIIE